MKYLFLIFIISCAIQPKKIIGPDGTEHQLITCSDIEICYSKAREACSGNYKIVNTTHSNSNVGDTVYTTTKLLAKCE